MGFLDDLLTGSSPRLETRSLSTISPEQRNALNALLSSLGRPSTAYTGQQNADLSNLENASLSALEERSRALATPDKNLEAAGASIRDQLDFRRNTADANDFFTNAVQNPALADFQRSVLPAISRDFGGGSFFSTERQNAEGLARRDLLEGLTAERSKVNLDQFNLSRDRALTAAGIVPSLTTAENSRTQTQMDILKAAGVKREVEQDALDRTYAEFVRQQEDAARREGLLQQASLTPTIENIGMTDPGNAGLIASLLGSIASGAGGQLGQGLGTLLGDRLGRLFNNDNNDPNSGQSTSGSSSTGSVVGGTAAGVVGGGLAGGGAGTPGGTVTVTDVTGNVVPSVSTVGGTGLGNLINSIQPGIQAGVAGTEAWAAGELAGLPMPTLNGAEAAGSAAGAPAGSGSSIASGVTTALGVAAALYGGYNTVQAAMQGDKKNAVMSGAATGAAAGSVIPVIGTAVGAVVGGLAGLVGASFGDKQQASEAAYGGYKKLPGEVSVRNWSPNQVYGAMFEAIKSHTKSGNSRRFADVGQMVRALGKSDNDYKGIQQGMEGFIKGVIQTAQASGGLPTSPADLAKIDGQQVYWKVVAPAMAAKIQEVTGESAQSNAWSGNLQQRYSDSTLHNMFADVTDFMMANWGGAATPNARALPIKRTLAERMAK